MPLVICTEELDRVHVGAGDTMGVMLQSRLTIPLNEPDGATARLNIALCPAEIVWEVGDPVAGPRLNPGAAVAFPASVMVCGLPGALSEMVTAPVRAPVVDGLKVTETWQLLPATTEALQVFVSPKF